MDLLIRNGQIVNFEKDSLEFLNLGLKDGKIVYLGREEKPAKKIIDAEGCIISPGFIDIHMHEEKIENDKYDIANYMLNMGVTTALGGNCGNNYESIKDMKEYIGKNGAPINYMALSGYTDLREKVGVDNRYRPASNKEIEEIIRLYREDIKNGAKGISFGIEYAPGISFDEIIRVAGSVKEEGILLAAHYRKDASKSLESIDELIEVSRTTGLPMQISHIGSCSAFGYMEETLGKIQLGIDQGVDLMADCYPYDAFSTRIGTSVFDDGCFENWNASYEDILLTEEPYKNIMCDEKLFKHVRENYPDMLVVAFVMNEAEVLQAYNEDFVMVASDGLYNKGQGHPRGAGTFPRVLNKYVGEGKLDLIDALKKMTLVPANRLGLINKGRIQVGSDGDLTIFRRGEIEDLANFDSPTLPPRGIDYVIIRGEIAVEKGQVLQDRLGQFIEK